MVTYNFHWWVVTVKIKNFRVAYLTYLIFYAITLSLAVEGARLPIVGGESNNWGGVLNSYLLVEHTENGTHKNLTVTGYVNISGVLYVPNISSNVINTNTIIVNNTLTTDTIIINKNLIVIGNITNTTVNNVAVNGSFYPTFDNAYDIGNGSLRWRNANFSGVVDSNSVRVNGKDVQLALDAFNINNFTLAYDSRNDRFTLQNLSRIGNVNISTSGSLNV